MSSFNKAAAFYDVDFSFTKIGHAQRNLVYAELQKIVSPGNLNILEINCGTGIDALFMAKFGNRVLATDIAEEMISTAQKNALNENLEFKVLDITQIKNTKFNQPFDFIFSNFGGLNCLNPNELTDFLAEIKSLLKPNGQFMAVVMPTFCLFESLYFLAKLSPKKAFRRLSKIPSLANVSGTVVKTWYYNPSFFVKKMASNFVAAKLKPIGFFIPPSYLEPLAQKFPKSFDFLSKMEQKIASIQSLSYLSDHFLISFRKAK